MPRWRGRWLWWRSRAPVPRRPTPSASPAIRRRTQHIQLGNDRALQLLDDSAQELKGATWSIDNPDLAEIRVEDGLTVVHPTAVGTVVVTATLGEETRTREVKIWSALRPLPPGATNWGLHPIGREIGD